VKAEKLPAKRVHVLVAVMAIWGLGIGVRLCFLQIVESADYIEKAKDQQQLVVEITPRRGDILDRDGNALAISVKVDSVFAHPYQMKNPRETARVLSRLTGVPREKLVKQFDPNKTFVWVKRKISDREKAAIEAARLPGVGFHKEFRRFYPNRDLAAHLLGYVDIDEEGKTGLERRYNGPIHGQPGNLLLLRDAHGKSFQREEKLPQAGSNLITTIDKNIQFVVERELKEAEARTRADAISIIVLDPRSGAILAMANSPTYNPNEYAAFDKSTWINHSLSLIYEPGSTFKMVAVAAALEEGLTTPDEIIDCQNGSITLFKRTIRDHNPYGLLSVREIIQNSSNVGTIKLAQRVGDEGLAAYVKRMGFGQRTSVDLPAEIPGLVWDLKDWEKTSFASIAIGQEIGVTPLQIVSFIGAIANGGILYKPYVVQKIQDPNGGMTEIKPSGHRVLSQTTARQIQEMLESVVTDGTAKASKLEGYTAAGKTGTAQKATPGKGYVGHKYVASFAGFAPAKNPQLAIVVVVDEPKGKYYGAEVAAPVFKRIAEQVLRSKGVMPDIPDYAPKYTATPAKKKPAAPKAPAKEVPEFKVLEAALDSPADASEDTLQLGEILVPDFSGQSFRQALAEVGKLGLTHVITGSGRVIAQNPPAGSRVGPGARIQLKLSQR
jgi:cell division protein FtsI (penicillin-binding protein 3)